MLYLHACLAVQHNAKFKAIIILSANDLALEISMTAGVALRFAPPETTAPLTTQRPGILVRMIRSLQNAQMRSAERKVAQFIQDHGAHLNDGLERQIADKAYRLGQF
jgi:hypothetical protein